LATTAVATSCTVSTTAATQLLRNGSDGSVGSGLRSTGSG
jgi:hypothetical protein